MYDYDYLCGLQDTTAPAGTTRNHRNCPDRVPGNTSGHNDLHSTPTRATNDNDKGHKISSRNLACLIGCNGE